MKLAIKGHATLGKEVIETLEMLGGSNLSLLFGDSALYYAINREGIISTHCEEQVIQFSLEEFLEKYPYKIGDGVIVEGKECFIEDVIWHNELNCIRYKVFHTTGSLTNGWYYVCNLQPYEEETIEESINDINKSIFKGNTQSCDIMNDIIKENREQIKIDIPEGYEFFGIDDNDKVVFTKIQPKYPKTYIECAKSLECFGAAHIDGYKCELLEKLQELLICRNAYWQIAGEELGLNRPWEPNYDSGVNKYGIICMNGVVQESNPTTNWERHLNKVLDFPTAEMRDAFYKNFKDLINECKDFI